MYDITKSRRKKQMEAVHENMLFVFLTKNKEFYTEETEEKNNLKGRS